MNSDSAKRPKRRRLRYIIGISGLLIIGISIALNLWVRPPEIKASPIGYDKPPAVSADADSVNNDTEIIDVLEGDFVPEEFLNENILTFVVLGIDDDASLTDTLMVGKFDWKNRKLAISSLPRDIMASVSWPVKKVNSLFNGLGGIDAIEDDGGFLDGLKDLLGFRVNSWLCVDTDAFVKLVDAIGGVYYDVPVDMVYEDYIQDLYIDIKAGYTLLSGEEALKVMRFREGYKVMPDIERIGTQQDFLMTVAKQVMKLDNIIFNIGEYVKIFTENVETSLSSGSIAFLAKEFLKLSSEDITFHTMPYTVPHSYDGKINKTCYLTVDPEPWLEMINEYINPYNKQVTINDVDLLLWDEPSLSAVSTQGSVYNINQIG